MPVTLEDRPTDSVREKVVDQLIMNYSHGEISHEAFERRLDQAMATDNNAELMELVADLSLTVDQDYQDKKQAKLNSNYEPGHAEDEEKVVSVFGSAKRAGAWKVAKNTRVISVFSNADVDLTEAIFSQKVHTIKVVSVFSETNVYTPENVKVVSKAFSIFGSVDNNAPTVVDSNSPTLVIEGYSIFSSVDIKIKRTIKERWVDFADSLKSLFGTSMK